MFIRKSQSKVVLLGTLANIIFSSLVTACNAPDEISFQIDPDAANQILNATVQINRYALTNRENLSNNKPSVEECQALVDQGAGHYRTEGLGTLVNIKDQTVILTHDHWGEMLRTADLVEVPDATGNHLRPLNNLEFRSLVIFSDSGTMVLFAPDGLDRTPAQLGNLLIIDGQELVLG